MRYFWDGVSALWPQDEDKDEGVRFPLCQPEPLQKLWVSSSLKHCTVAPLDVPTEFSDFDDYWSPFLGGQFPAPDYAMNLPEEDRARLREHLRGSLPIAADGTISLIARAWGVKGRVAPV